MSIQSDLAWWVLNEKVDSLAEPRQKALREVRHRIDRRVWVSRMPDRVTDYTMTITRVGSERAPLINAEQKQTRTTLQVDIWSRNPDAGETVQEIQDNLRIAIVNYTGKINGTWVGSVSQDRDSVFSTPPSDGSVDWEFQSSADYTFTYNDRIA